MNIFKRNGSTISLDSLHDRVYTENMQNVHFTPPEIARLIGVNESTVKRWIDKGVLTAEKTPGGHRRVSRNDIQKFVASHKKYADQSYILKKICPAGTELDYEVYYLNLLERRYEEGRKFLHKTYISGVPIIDIIEKIIAPTLAVVGEGWRKGVLSIESEHRITFVVRQHLMVLEQFIGAPNRTKNAKVLLACVPGDNHELVLHILSLALRSFGHETEVLGINISEEELARAAKSYKPDHIVLSKVYTPITLKESYVRGVEKLARDLGIQVHIGGRGWKKKDVEVFQKHIKSIRVCESLKDLEKLNV
jgi:excisionase family DNA binding protein